MQSRSIKPTLAPSLQALTAAALFGASAPLAKILLGEIGPVVLAGLLYLGSGLALLAILGLRRWLGRAGQPEARIGRSDLPWLLGAILAGGIAAPILLLTGLRATPASTASLLLNFEGAATALIAALLFREAIGRRVAWAVAAVTLASVLLSWRAGSWGLSLGGLAILGACALWGLDNNLTRCISAKDPLAIVTSKGLVAGAFSLALGRLLGQAMPSAAQLLGALALGSLSYGLSIVLFVQALRGLGAARSGALYGLAPFVGAAISFLLLGEPLTAQFLLSLPLMALGAALLIGEAHGHWHWHGAAQHDHRHRHDDGHHTHRHAGSGWRPNQAHAHPHGHEPLGHEHCHAPDIHHRHNHAQNGDPQPL
jgi:drug/metabolite transporter (DMT)-like permease